MTSNVTYVSSLSVSFQSIESTILAAVSLANQMLIKALNRRITKFIDVVQQRDNENEYIYENYEADHFL